MRQGWTIPTEPPKYVYTFEKDDDWTVRIVVSKDDRPEDFYNPGKTLDSHPSSSSHYVLTPLRLLGRDRVAEVHCNPTELMEDPKTNRKYCEVELLLTVGKLNVRCCQCPSTPLITIYSPRLLIRNALTIYRVAGN